MNLVIAEMYPSLHRGLIFAFCLSMNMIISLTFQEFDVNNQIISFIDQFGLYLVIGK